MKTATLIAYFANHDASRNAYRKLWYHGYRRIAWLSKNADGIITVKDPFCWLWVMGLVVFTLLGLLAGRYANALFGVESLSIVGGPALFPGLPGGIVGLLSALACFRRSRFGVERLVLENHKRWLIPNETVIILQAPVGVMPVPADLLRQGGDVSPVLFVLHPELASPVLAKERDKSLSDALEPIEYAKQLAHSQPIDRKRLHNMALLKRLERCRQSVQKASHDLAEMNRMEKRLPLTAEWLVENEYILESNARDIRMNLPWAYYRQLPALSAGGHQGFPRIYALAYELTSRADLRLDEDGILEFLTAYQTVAPLSIGELWAIPQMLRLALVECIQHIASRAMAELREWEAADFWANRLIAANRGEANHLFGMMAELTITHPAPSPCFATRLFDSLYDEEHALAPVREWMERAFHTPMNDVIIREKSRQTMDQQSVGNAFCSLRQLGLLDWKECFEQLSTVEQTLRRDPAGLYPKMDFATRDCYRRAVEDLHRGSLVPEDQVAQAAVDLAVTAPHNPEDAEAPQHIGLYLIGSKRPELARHLGCREAFQFRAAQWAQAHHTAVYLGGVSLISAALLALAVWIGVNGYGPWIQLLVAVLLLVPISQMAVNIVNYLVMRLLPPRLLPKMNFKISGIPNAFRTLVVIPMMLDDIAGIKRAAEKLEIRFLANKDANLFFTLFSDYHDDPQMHNPNDAALLQTAKECIETLNQRYGANRFYLLHRERVWCETERIFMGWERKRGKLEELNRLIAGAPSPEDARMVIVGDARRLPDMRFVITLDSDTQLPHGTARRMIETLAHPLNQPRFDALDRIRAGTYIIIQPRVTPSLPSASGSLFSRLFSDPVGVDAYSHAASDAYQDLVGEGSYHGKGIYDVRAFSRILTGRFPEGQLLSHDLIEGAHVRVGLASDIVLYDDFPQNYISYAKREHRWVRGDWQIAGWILPTVPRREGGTSPNMLSWFERWKLLDNLRRSLLPATSMTLLLLSWLFIPGVAVLASAAIAMQFLSHTLVRPFIWATTGRSYRDIVPAQIVHDLLRMLVEAVLLPYQAFLTLDAIIRTLYRCHISHRKLLEWSVAQSERETGTTTRFLLMMAMFSLSSVMVGWTIVQWNPESFAMASPWLALWFLSCPVGWLLCCHTRSMLRPYRLPAKDRDFLRGVARLTWRYFADFVNEKSSWLPPDNYQVVYQNQLAMRTSPTNIGLYLASILCAHDFGYLTADEVAQRLGHTLETLARMERHEGHLFNWYDIQTLLPLKPCYVSTVDSGNLLGSLWTMDQGLVSLSHAALIAPQAFEGLCDSAGILKRAFQKSKISGPDMPVLDGLLYAWKSPGKRATDLLNLLQLSEQGLHELGTATWVGHPDRREETYWLHQLQSHVAAWRTVANRYLAWIEVLNEKTDIDIGQLHPGLLAAFQQARGTVPSLMDLAEGNVACVPFLTMAREQVPGEDHETHDWLVRIGKALEQAKWLAGEMVSQIAKLASAGRELSDSMNMNFLYNTERDLFSVGFNVSEGRLDRAFYDLLASEARIGSFVAIARGDIPAAHWFAMGRPFGSIGSRRALLSWTGTMFEYLMPLLFQRSFGHSLLDKAVKEAVEIQIAYGRKHHVPWGISECAYSDLDHNKTFQYSAFGVPELGLKRRFEDKLVVAPYACMLAVGVAPRESVKNMKRLVDMDLLNDYGFYESIDYSCVPEHEGTRGAIVKTYMAHHQGMAFLSLANFLRADCLRNHFRADPRIRTFELLLQERIPHAPPLHHIETRERISSVAALGEIVPSVSQFETPHTITPRTQLLSNGRYGLMLTNAGGGYSRWGEFALTRWRSDRTCDAWGSFCYIHDTDANQLWCNTYQPIAGKVGSYGVSFTLDRAEYRRTDADIETQTEIVVAPEDDVEIRRITLVNRSGRIRHLALTSYAELVLAPHRADMQHPAFNKMFIQTEAVQELQALLAWRRPRSEKETPVFAAHRMTLERTAGSGEEALHFETDRRRFIGRGHTLAEPMGATQQPGNSQGFVLDPIFSLRQGITLAPGQRIQVSLILAAGPSRERVVSLMHKYADPHAIDRAMDLAWTSAQLDLRLLRIQADDARRFQQIASHLLYPNPLLRSNVQRLGENRKGQSGLWAYAISGDMPIVLLTIGEVRDIPIVRQALQAHTFWRLHGLAVDLVILNEEASGYAQPLKKELEHLIQSHAELSEIDRPGGVYVRAAELIPPEDVTLIRAAASVVLVAARGTLVQQLGIAQEALAIPDHLPKSRDPRDASAALPFMDLQFFNSLGGFTPDGREYAIYLGPGIHTPAPWVNVIANDGFGTVVSETGAGFTWQGNSQRNRLTSWSNDPVTDPSSEAMYIRDEDTGAYWTPTASPIREGTSYRARHGAGYTVFEHNSHGIEQEVIVFVPMGDEGGDPVKLQRLFLRNDTNRPRRLSVTYYAEWVLGESRESSQMHVVTAWDEELQALLARNYYNPDYPNQCSFAAISLPATSYTGDRTVFLGRNRSMAEPSAMKRTRLSRRTGAGLDPCAAIQVRVDLAPGERKEVTCMLGQAASVEQVRALVRTYRDPVSVEEALRQTQAWWDTRLDVVQVSTPERSADLLINRWLLYQTLACRIWARSAFYQSGGAFGFRDQLQDVMALLHADPQLAREHILLAASRQFKEGDVQHWWHPPAGGGIRSRVSDDLLWLPFVVAHYVQITGDAGILKEEIPFLDAPILDVDHHESFQHPAVSTESGALFEHCRRALTQAARFGARGLPLMGSGDWNDGMNLVGAQGQGESVWLAWFMADVMRRMADMADLLGEPEQAETYRQDRIVLIEKIERFGWDGGWYLRATFDDGTPLGSSANAEAKIDSLPQSWASLSDAADPERAAKALDAAWTHLVKEDEGLVLLFEPPFDTSLPSPGYIKGYPPGVRENGGQYTHAAVWMAMALARRGDGTRAAHVLRMINPIEHAREPESVWRYGLEPYAVAADIYRLPGRIGQGGWSWYTGSAAWMYRAWVEDVLGLDVRGETLRIVPAIPALWDSYQIIYRHGEAQYEIRVENPDHCEGGIARIELDGQSIPDGVIKLERNLVKHRVSVRMGESRHAACKT